MAIREIRFGPQQRINTTGIFVGVKLLHRGQELTIRVDDLARFDRRPSERWLDDIVAARGGDKEAIFRLQGGGPFSQLLKQIDEQWTILQSTVLKEHKDVAEVTQQLINLGEKAPAQAHNPREQLSAAMDLFLLMDKITDNIQPPEKRSAIRGNILNPIGGYLNKEHNVGILRPAVDSEYDLQTQHISDETIPFTYSRKTLVSKVVMPGFYNIKSGSTIRKAVVTVK